MEKKKSGKKLSLMFFLWGLILFPPGIANEYVFAHLKSSILREIETLMDMQQYQKAYDLAEKYVDKNDAEIVAFKKEVEEKLLYKQTRSVPAEKILLNRRLYEVLRSFDPTEKLYEEKWKHYNYLVSLESQKKKLQAEKVASKRLSQIESRKTKEKQALIRRNQIQIGMTEGEVLAGWGGPDALTVVEGPKGKVTRWEYPDWRYAYFEKGLCIAFTQGLEPETE